MILGIDAGNRKTKVVTSEGAYLFESAMGEYRERRLKDRFGEDDMVFEYEGRRGFAGTLALYESEFVGTRKGETKAHEEAKLRVLLAIHRYSCDMVNDIVVGQPISTHTEEEKKKIIDMLKGEHILAVDYGDGLIEKKIVIRRVRVAVEGCSAVLTQPTHGLVRIIDVGSGTINFGTVDDMRLVDRDSFTERFGLETIKSRDYAALARKIANTALTKWNEFDIVKLIGGGAIPLIDHLRAYFPNCELLQPMHNGKVLSPVFANVVAFYRIGEVLYGERH
ncbi:ParM/StbA family protein [Geobacillus stearothermophilus]|uniref:ParM/StbA family protein n=1 Tax=Geobacillus stearothermophilus TaxID=1422 RepID=UPI002E1D9842|nr:ParM/StbA family protein [Geobacillus stearothermophilus]